MTQAQPASAAPGAPGRPNLVATLGAGGTLKDTLGLTGGDMDAIYGLAFNLYEQGRYEDAERAFGTLCLNDHRAPKHWMGLGASRQLRKDYEGAVLAYSMAAQFGARDPMAPLHAAECYLALGLHEEAISGLEAALAWAGESDQPAMVVGRVQLMVERLDGLMAPAAADEAGGAQAAPPAAVHT